MEFMLVNNCHKAGLGTIQEINTLIKVKGKDWVQQLLRFKSIDQENNG